LPAGTKGIPVITSVWPAAAARREGGAQILAKSGALGGPFPRRIPPAPVPPHRIRYERAIGDRHARKQSPRPPHRPTLACLFVRSFTLFFWRFWNAFDSAQGVRPATSARAGSTTPKVKAAGARTPNDVKSAPLRRPRAPASGEQVAL